MNEECIYFLLKKLRKFPVSQISFQGWYLKEDMRERFQVKVPGMVKESLFAFRTQSVCSPRPKTGRQNFIPGGDVFLPLVFSWVHIKVFFQKMMQALFCRICPYLPLVLSRLWKFACTLDVFWRNLNQPISIYNDGMIVKDFAVKCKLVVCFVEPVEHNLIL